MKTFICNGVETRHESSLDRKHYNTGVYQHHQLYRISRRFKLIKRARFTLNVSGSCGHGYENVHGRDEVIEICIRN